MARRDLIGSGIAVAAFIAIALATLVPTDADTSESFLWCIACDRARARDFVANVGLFVPLGFGLVFAGWSVARAAAASLALSVAVELAQAFVIIGRYASLGDVLANFLGATIGAVVGALVVRAVVRSRRSRS